MEDALEEKDALEDTQDEEYALKDTLEEDHAWEDAPGAMIRHNALGGCTHKR